MFDAGLLVDTLREMAKRYEELSGDQKWDHVNSYRSGVAAGLAFAAGRLEEKMLQDAAA